MSNPTNPQRVEASGIWAEAAVTTAFTGSVNKAHSVWL